MINFLTVIDIVFTCIEAWFALLLLQNEEIKGKSYKQLILFGTLVISVVIMSKADCGLLFKWVVQVLIIVVVGSFVYECGIFKLLLYGLLAICALVISEEIVISIWNIYNKPVYTDNIIYEEFVLSLLITSHALYFLIIMLFKKITSKDKERRTLKEVIPILCIGIPFLLVFECLNLDMQLNETIEMKSFRVLTSTAILFAFIYILIFFEKHLAVQKKAQEEAMALQEMQLKYEYYARRKEDEEKVREIYHDLKNHLLFMQDNELTQKIVKKIENYESYIDTGNEFLDIILSEKIEDARHKDIKIECKVDFRSGDFIQPLDISTIFGNLLDNAIEAAEKIEEEERYIFVNAGQKEKLLLIVIRNSMSGIYDKHTKSSKTNNSFHGYGLTNVKKAVRKYNGECSIQSEDREFIVSVLLPVQGKGIC